MIGESGETEEPGGELSEAFVRDILNMVRDKMDGQSIRLSDENRLPLVSCALSETAFGTVETADGYFWITANAISEGVVTDDGTAVYIELYQEPDYSGYIAGEVGLVGSGATCELTSLALKAGEKMNISSFVLKIKSDFQ